MLNISLTFISITSNKEVSEINFLKILNNNEDKALISLLDKEIFELPIQSAMNLLNIQQDIFKIKKDLLNDDVRSVHVNNLKNKTDIVLNELIIMIQKEITNNLNNKTINTLMHVASILDYLNFDNNTALNNIEIKLKPISVFFINYLPQDCTTIDTTKLYKIIKQKAKAQNIILLDFTKELSENFIDYLCYASLLIKKFEEKQEEYTNIFKEKLVAKTEEYKNQIDILLLEQFSKQQIYNIIKDNILLLENNPELNLQNIIPNINFTTMIGLKIKTINSY